MAFLRQLRIGARLGLAFAAVILLMLAMAGMAARQTGVMHEALAYYAGNTTPSLQAIKAWKADAVAIREMQALHLMASTDAEMSALEQSIQKAEQRLAQNIAGYENLVSDDAEKRLWQAVIAAGQAAAATWSPLKAVSRQTADDPAKLEQARKLFVGDSARTYRAFVEAIEKDWAFNVSLADKLAENGGVIYRDALWQIGLLAAAALALGTAAAVLVARSVTRPIGRAVHIAGQVAAGQLGQHIEAEGQDEPAQLLQALAHMNESLVRIVGQVRASSDSIATGTSQIALGNADLSQRTEEQASNLQQTAASMEQLTGTVQHSAETAREADRLAAVASEAATEGGRAVGQVVATMQDIAEASRKINDIIAVIDGIAFQTNILALNAAVEAARAGEQGRGFAVVAGEVRALAQRSALAAKEIAGLIGDSVGKVEAGTRQVDAAGQTMERIVGQVRRVSELIGEISNATLEQTQGIGQVGQAVSQLDQVTQQNAALVEESAAAAESLRLQAAQLAELVSVFKLEGAAAGAVIG
jgi:methyl-accepting chemotaxis protein